MSKGLGVIERLVMAELKCGRPVELNKLALNVMIRRFGIRKENILIERLPATSPGYQSVARAVRSLTNKGMIQLNT